MNLGPHVRASTTRCCDDGTRSWHAAHRGLFGVSKKKKINTQNTTWVSALLCDGSARREPPTWTVRHWSQHAARRSAHSLIWWKQAAVPDSWWWQVTLADNGFLKHVRSGHNCRRRSPVRRFDSNRSMRSNVAFQVGCDIASRIRQQDGGHVPSGTTTGSRCGWRRAWRTRLMVHTVGVSSTQRVTFQD